MYMYNMYIYTYIIHRCIDNSTTTTTTCHTSCHIPVPFGRHDNSIEGGRLVCIPYCLAHGHMYLCLIGVG